MFARYRRIQTFVSNRRDVRGPSLHAEIGRTTSFVWQSRFSKSSTANSMVRTEVGAAEVIGKQSPCTNGSVNSIQNPTNEPRCFRTDVGTNRSEDSQGHRGLLGMVTHHIGFITTHESSEALAERLRWGRFGTYVATSSQELNESFQRKIRVVLCRSTFGTRSDNDFFVTCWAAEHMRNQSNTGNYSNSSMREAHLLSVKQAQVWSLCFFGRFTQQTG